MKFQLFTAFIIILTLVCYLDYETTNNYVVKAIMDDTTTKLMHSAVEDRQRYLKIKSLPTDSAKNVFIDSVYNKDQADALGLQKYVNTTALEYHLDSTRILVDYYITLKK